MLLKLIKNLLFVAILALFISDAVMAKHEIITRMDDFHRELTYMTNGTQVKNAFKQEIIRIVVNQENNRCGAMIEMLRLMTVADYFFDLHGIRLSWGIIFTGLKDFIKPQEDYGHTEDIPTIMKNNKALIAEILDWDVVVDIFRVLDKDDIRRMEIEWACFLCIHAIEASNHLQKSFTKAMMISLDYVRLRANDLCVIDLIENPNQPIPIYFTFDAIMINKNLAIDGGKSAKAMRQQIKKMYVEDAVKILIYSRKLFLEIRGSPLLPEARTLIFEFVRSMVHFAFADLTDKELVDYPNEIAYTLLLTAYLPKQEVLKKFHKALHDRVNATLADKNSPLSIRLKELRMAKDQETRINSVSDPEYLNLAAIAFNLMVKGKVNANLDGVFYKSIDRILADDVFNNRELLEKYDKYYIDLYNANDEQIRKRNTIWTDDSTMDGQLDIILTKANALLEKTKRSGFESMQLQILCRLGLKISNIRFKTDSSNGRILENVISNYIRTQITNSELNTKDSAVIKEWYHCVKSFPINIAKKLDKKMINELVEFVTNQLKKPKSEADAVHYIFLVRCANVLVDRKRKSDTKALAKKIFELELKIGEGNILSNYVYNTFVRERERYYISFATDALDFQQPFDIKAYMDRAINIMSSSQYADEDFDALQKAKSKYFLIKAIFSAVKNNPSLVDQLKGDTRCKKIAHFQTVYLKTIYPVRRGKFAEISTFPTHDAITKLFGFR